MENENESAPLPPSPDYPALTSDIVSAYVAHNSVPRTDLAPLIASVHAALSGASKPAPVEEPPTPPVAINKTIRPDYIISLEDGRQYRSLKRHLTARGLTPEQYRAKWGLRPDYPMVAPNYSKARSDLARALGLGQSRKGKSGARKAAAEGGAKKAAKRARK
jgi:predicted transcriptional regulator